MNKSLHELLFMRLPRFYHTELHGEDTGRVKLQNIFHTDNIFTQLFVFIN